MKVRLIEIEASKSDFFCLQGLKMRLWWKKSGILLGGVASSLAALYLSTVAVASIPAKNIESSVNNKPILPSSRNWKNALKKNNSLDSNVGQNLFDKGKESHFKESIKDSRVRESIAKDLIAKVSPAKDSRTQNLQLQAGSYLCPNIPECELKVEQGDQSLELRIQGEGLHCIANRLELKKLEGQSNFFVSEVFDTYVKVRGNDFFELRTSSRNTPHLSGNLGKSMCSKIVGSESLAFSKRKSVKMRFFNDQVKDSTSVSSNGNTNSKKLPKYPNQRPNGLGNGGRFGRDDGGAGKDYGLDPFIGEDGVNSFYPEGDEYGDDYFDETDVDF